MNEGTLRRWRGRTDHSNLTPRKWALYITRIWFKLTHHRPLFTSGVLIFLSPRNSINGIF